MASRAAATRNVYFSIHSHLGRCRDLARLPVNFTCPAVAKRDRISRVVKRDNPMQPFVVSTDFGSLMPVSGSTANTATPKPSDSPWDRESTGGSPDSSAHDIQGQLTGTCIIPHPLPHDSGPPSMRGIGDGMIFQANHLVQVTKTRTTGQSIDVCRRRCTSTRRRKTACQPSVPAL